MPGTLAAGGGSGVAGEAWAAAIVPDRAGRVFSGAAEWATGVAFDAIAAASESDDVPDEEPVTDAEGEGWYEARKKPPAIRSAPMPTMYHLAHMESLPV